MQDQSREYGQREITLPHDVVPLPSGGLFYKNKKKSLKVGYLTAQDENILMAGGNDLTISLLRNKIYEPDLRIEDLLQGDVEAILVFLRNTGFGPEMSLSLKDPKNGNPFNTTVMLDQLSTIDGQKPNEDGTFTIQLPKTNSTVKLKPLTYGEILDIEKQAETYPQGRVAPKITWTLNKQIVEVNGTTDKGEIAKFIESLPIMDSKHIRKFLNENEPRLDMVRVVIAPSGEKLAVNVGFGVEFFRPFF